MFVKIKNTLIIFFFIGICNVFAAPPSAIFKDWTVFETIQDNRKICYIATLPIKKEGNYRKRGEPFLLVTRVKGRTTDEISVSSGYLYDQKKPPEIEIDKKKFPTFVYEEKAWTTKKEDDVTIIEQMKKSTKMTVTGYSKFDTFSTDTYSLVGFTEAYDKMVELCQL